jgi:hypothetical protein
MDLSQNCRDALVELTERKAKLVSAEVALRAARKEVETQRYFLKHKEASVIQDIAREAPELLSINWKLLNKLQRPAATELAETALGDVLRRKGIFKGAV